MLSVSCHTRKAGKNIKSNCPLIVCVSCNDISDSERGQHNFLVSLAIMLPLTTSGVARTHCAGITRILHRVRWKDITTHSELKRMGRKPCHFWHSSETTEKNLPRHVMCSAQDSYTGKIQYRCPVIRLRTGQLVHFKFSHLVRSEIKTGFELVMRGSPKHIHKWAVIQIKLHYNTPFHLFYSQIINVPSSTWP
jgi:hypothetical protein